MTLIYLLLLISFSFLLVRLTSGLIIHLKKLNDRMKIGDFAIAGVFLALATSLPELFVGITSALEESPSISLGNIVGANIANLSLVAGLAALIGGTLNIRNGTIKEDLLHAFIGGAAPLILLFDRTLSRIDALILITLYGFYNFTILSKRRRGFEEEDENFICLIFRRLKPKDAKIEVGWLFLHIIGILVFADLIVRLSKLVALGLGMPVFLVALLILSVGTTLPELAFELEAVRKKESSMFMGNLIGSIVANGTLVIGVAALIEPIKLEVFNEYILSTAFFVFIFFLFFVFTQTKHRLERWEGGVLIITYELFILLEMI